MQGNWRGRGLEVLHHVIEHAVLDSIKMLPFLFAAFLLIEAFEKISEKFSRKVLEKVGVAGPLVGALLGCIPQCGFSVMASNFYAGGMISVGTLLAVFLASSDEAILMMISHPQHRKEILYLVVTKIVIAVAAGYSIDCFLRKKITEEKEIDEICHDCGCHTTQGIVIPAIKHSIRIFFYILIFTIILNFVIEWFGMEQLSTYLLGNTIAQPIVAALIGLIPNCAASVVLTQLYINGMISFPSVVAGLCTSAGVALPVLFKMNHHRKENIKIVGLLLGVAIGAGIILQIILL